MGRGCARRAQRHHRRDGPQPAQRRPRRQGGINNREIASELEDNAEAGQIVSALEQQYDAFVEGQERQSLLATEAEDLPSADELGADIEEFLRNVSDD